MSSTSSKRGLKGTLYNHKTEVSFTNGKSSTSQKSAGDCQIQNVPSARVYVFGNSDVAEDEILNDDEEEQIYELRPRGKQRQNQKQKESEVENEPVSIEREIQKGETLAKIAVKYCCEVADLKRLNNLLNEQDFFALSKIKVPVQRHGLVRERLEEEIREMQTTNSTAVSTNINGSIPFGASVSKSTHAVFELTDHTSGDDEHWAGITDVSDGESETQNLLVQKVSIAGALKGQGKDAQDFLKRMDSDIKHILTSSNSAKRNLDEVRSTLTCRRIYPLKRRDSILGADCGMKLGTIVVILIIVALVTPLIYFLYYEYFKPPEMHTQNHPGDSVTENSSS